jgi:hypothetical protein
MMLQTAIESPNYWKEFRHQLGLLVRLFSQNAQDLPVAPPIGDLRAEFIRLANDILDEAATVSFIRAHDTLARVRRQAAAVYEADPSDKLAHALFGACSTALGYLLSLRCLSAYSAPVPTTAPALCTDEAGSSSSLIINYSNREPMMAVVERLDSPPTAVAAMLAAERAAEAGSTVPGTRDHAGNGPGTNAADAVHFSVSAPRLVQPGSAFVIDIWAFLAGQRDEILKRAARSAVDPSFFMREKGPAPLSRGTLLTVRLRMPDLLVDEEEDTLLWEGEIASTGFPVRAPASASPGDRPGTVVFLAHGLTVAKVHFTIRVGAERTMEPSPVRVEGKPFRTAFASYASEDRDEVLSVIQGLQKAVPGLDVFLDVAQLRSGQKWQDQLWSAIPSREVFYLFWSEAASRSPWVEKEWRCAVETRGIGFIDPVPLVSPEIVPPPKELGELHFNDWVLAFKRRAGAAHAG